MPRAAEWIDHAEVLGRIRAYEFAGYAEVAESNTVVRKEDVLRFKVSV